jgi:hypothetical protein
MDPDPRLTAIRALVEKWRERDVDLHRKADAHPQYARTLVERAECYDRCAYELEAALAVEASPQQDQGIALRLRDRVDAIARALYVAGIRSDLDKDGLPRLVAEGILLNLRKVQKIDLYRVQPAVPAAVLSVEASPRAAEADDSHLTFSDALDPNATWNQRTRKEAVMELPDIEVVSAKVHEAWMQSKAAQGVTSRKAEDGEELIAPYEQLSDKAKELDRGTVRAVYDAIRAASPRAEPT